MQVSVNGTPTWVTLEKIQVTVNGTPVWGEVCDADEEGAMQVSVNGTKFYVEIPYDDEEVAATLGTHRSGGAAREMRD